MIQDILRPGEEVLYLTTGMHEDESDRKVIMVTDQRVVIYSKTDGGTHQEFPYDKIASVQHKAGISLGEITISAGPATRRLINIPKAEVLEVVKLIKERLPIGAGSV